MHREQPSLLFPKA